MAGGERCGDVAGFLKKRDYAERLAGILADVIPGEEGAEEERDEENQGKGSGGGAKAGWFRRRGDGGGGFVIFSGHNR